MSYNIIGSGYNYLGVTSITPPNLQLEVNAPTVNDLNAKIGDFWLQKNTANLWYLTDQANQQATWTPIGAANITFDTDSGSCTSVSAVMQTPGGDNMNTTGAGDTYTVNLDTSILQPLTTADGLNGVYALGVTDYTTDRFMHAYGTANTFLGRGAGNLTLNAAESNVVIGDTGAPSLNDGSGNVTLGASAGLALYDGDYNVAVGFVALPNVDDGSYNISLGASSGLNFVGSESSNILLNSNGVAADSNVLRIGQATGVGNQELDAAYIQGIYQKAVDITQEFMVIDADGKMGSVMGGAGGASTFVTDSGNAIENAGAINVLGGANINTEGAGDTVTINLNTSIALPATNASGTEGVYALDGVRFMHAFGTSNTFVGEEAGNLTVVGTSNVGLGFQALTVADNAADAVAVGYLSQASVTDGLNNTSIGSESLSSLVDGDYNLSLGYQSGVNLNSSQSSNIYLSNQGNVLDNNVMRLGTSGNGANQVDEAYVAGTYGRTVDAISSQIVVIDNVDKIGSAELTSSDNSVTIDISTPGVIDLSVQGGVDGWISGVADLTTIGSAETASADIFAVPANSSGMIRMYAIGRGLWANGARLSAQVYRQAMFWYDGVTLYGGDNGQSVFNFVYQGVPSTNTLKSCSVIAEPGAVPTNMRLKVMVTGNVTAPGTVDWKVLYSYFILTP